MKPLQIFIAILLLIFSSTAKSQIIYNGDIVRIEKNPTNKFLFILKKYSAETKRVTEYWNIKSTVEDVNVSNYNQLYNEKKVYPNGKHCLLYPNLKVKHVDNYILGEINGEFKGYYKTGELKYNGYYNLVLDGKLTHYYKSGAIRKVQNIVKGIRKGKTKEYYPDGQLLRETKYFNNKKNGNCTSYYRDGKLKRKIIYENNEVDSQKCYNKSKKKTDCIPMFKAPKLNGDLNLLNKEINKIDFSFIPSETEKTTCTIILQIDSEGKPSLNSVLIDKTKTLVKQITKWVSQLSEFTPALYEENPVESNLIISFAVAENRVLFLDSVYTKTEYSNSIEIYESNLTFYREHPIPSDKSEISYLVVEKMPRFPGGEENLLRFIKKNIRYPKEAQQKNIQGKVYVSVTIDKTGKPTNPKIKTGVNPLLDAEAIRIVRIMPKWIPGETRNKKVSVLYLIPINFVLKP